MSKQHQAARKALLEKALSLPGAWEDHPWGETVVKVGKKIFIFLGNGEGGFGCSVKLEHTSEAALTTFPWCAPTGYGLGKSGWVTAQFEGKQDVPVPLLVEWMQESYAAVAPKRGAKGGAAVGLPASGSRLPAEAKAKAKGLQTSGSRLRAKHKAAEAAGKKAARTGSKKGAAAGKKSGGAVRRTRR